MSNNDSTRYVTIHRFPRQDEQYQTLLVCSKLCMALAHYTTTPIQRRASAGKSLALPMNSQSLNDLDVQSVFNSYFAEVLSVGKEIYV